MLFTANTNHKWFFKSKILFSCSGIMILKYKNSVLRVQLKLKSGIFRLGPPNFVSHNANLNVKEGYIMVPRELRWCHRCWLIQSHCLCSRRAYVILSQLPPLCNVWMCSYAVLCSSTRDNDNYLHVLQLSTKIHHCQVVTSKSIRKYIN